MITELSRTAKLSDGRKPTPSRRQSSAPTIRTRWLDSLGRPLVDRDEVPVAGLSVSLRDEHEIEVGRTTTDASGRYRFDDLAAGDYLVVFTVPAAVGTHNRVEPGLSSYWPDDLVAPTPVHTWRPMTDGVRYCLEGTLS